MACLTLLVPASTLWGPGRGLSAPPSHARRSATTAWAVRCFGLLMSAIHSRRRRGRGWPQPALRPVSCYAFVRGWLPLSLPPGRLRGTALAHCWVVRRLSGRSGLSPSRPGTLARPGLPRPSPGRLRRIQWSGHAHDQGPTYLGTGSGPAILKYVSRKTSYHQVW